MENLTLLLLSLISFGRSEDLLKNLQMNYVKFAYACHKVLRNDLYVYVSRNCFKPQGKERT